MLQPGSINTHKEAEVKYDSHVQDYIFKDKEHVFNPLEAKTVSMYLPVPIELQAVRNTCLCEIQCILSISLIMRGFASLLMCCNAHLGKISLSSWW